MAREEDESVASLMRSLGMEPELEEDDSPALAPALAQAGPRLKGFRERSGWTAPEISERTGVSLRLLQAFEAGRPVAADELLPALERLASACCCSIEELGLERLDLSRPVRRSRRSRPKPLW
jgi:ribosome-binding protein aMBF1 (putative translation factor)